MPTEVVNQTKAINDLRRSVDNLVKVTAALNNTVVDLVKEIKTQREEAVSNEN